MAANTWAFIVWIVLLTAACMVYPRRPVLSAVLFFSVGLLSVVLYSMRAAGESVWGALFGVCWMGLGGWYLFKFRTADARKKHVDYWTEKA